jgi:hypothetical protein
MIAMSAARNSDVLVHAKGYGRERKNQDAGFRMAVSQEKK